MRYDSCTIECTDFMLHTADGDAIPRLRAGPIKRGDRVSSGCDSQTSWGLCVRAVYTEAVYTEAKDTLCGLFATVYSLNRCF